MSNYEFPEYAPSWKDEVEGDEEEGWFWDEEKANALKPDEIVDKEQGVEWRHIVQTMRNLVEKHHYSGPFSDKEVGDELTQVIVDETLTFLQEKGLIESTDSESFKLTELGEKIAKEINGPSSSG